MGLVQYNQQTLVTRRVYYTGTTALTRGAVLVYESQTTFAAFTQGPGVDVKIPDGTDNEVIAGIVDDSAVGSTGGWIDVIVPRPGDVIWCKVDAGLDSGDGVVLQASQALDDGGAYAAGDIGVCLMDEDAADNPYGDDNLAPILFSIGVA